tara:strand:+ start:461 stop:2509 length:2049 start_codon:yes stop_codon:yes gene_type:complete
MSQHNTNTTQRFRTSTERSPFRTVAGSYEAPVEGIVDYDAFSRGFESTFQEPEQKTIELEGLKKVFDGGAKGNKLTDGEDIYDDVLGDELIKTWGVDNSPNFRKSDIQGQNNYLKNVGQVQKAINNKGSLYKNVGDHQLNDTNFNFNVIDENGKEIPGLTPAVINRVHGDPSLAKNRRLGTKDVIVNGKKVGEKAGEYMTIRVPDPTGKGGLLKMKEKEVFINYEDMDENWQAKTFELNYGHEASLSENKPKGFENKVVAGQMLEKKYDQQTIVGGKTIAAGSTRNIISDDWYNDTESKMNLAVDKVFNFDQGVMGDGYESAFRQFREQDFKLNPNTIKMLKNAGVNIDRASQITDEMAANIPDAEKVNMLRDWWVQSSLITNASIGYDRDVDKQLKKKDYTDDEIKNGFAVRGDETIELFEKDGKLFKKGTNRAIENNVKIDRRYKEQPFDEDIDKDIEGEGKSSIVEDRLFNISSNLNSTTFRFTNENQSNTFVKPGEETEIDPGTLLQGFFSDTDGTKATIISAKVKNIGTKDTIVNGKEVKGKDKHVIEIKYEAGKDENVETFDLDETGRRKLTERAYKGQFAGEKDIATDLATGEENYQIKRQAVQEAFKAAGKDVTMRRRLNIINNYNSDPSNPETWNTLNDEDIKLLKGSAKDTYLGKAYEKFLDEEAGKEFDNN